MQETGGLGRWESAEGEAGDEGGKAVLRSARSSQWRQDSWGPDLCARHLKDERGDLTDATERNAFVNCL